MRLSKILTLIFLVTGATVVGGGVWLARQGPADAGETCVVAPHNQLCPTIPHDLPLDAQQADFDRFSWQSFVGLNWPSAPDGAPALMALGSDPRARRVWEHYAAPETVFQPDGTRPAYLGELQVPQACEGLADADGKVVNRFSKLGDVVAGLDSSLQAVVGQPLIDQNLNFILAEIGINKEEFDFIVGRGFFQAETQQAFESPAINMPSGRTDGPLGAIEIKAAWRFLDLVRDAAILDRYYTQQGLVYVRPNDSQDRQPLCIEAILGLVGFHITHKTEHFPQWIWSTFEHVDNVRRGRGLPEGFGPTLQNPDCHDLTRCPPNRAPSADPAGGFAWAPQPPFALAFPPTQVVRTTPISDTTATLNRQWQALLSDTVWQYYELVGTQAPGDPLAFDPDQLVFGKPQPVPLANTTMETYLQPTSSCVGCHGGRTQMAENTRTFPDFSFALGHACFSLAYRDENNLDRIDKPCAGLVLGEASKDAVEPVQLANSPLSTRPIELAPGAGAFVLSCELAGPEVEVEIDALPGAVQFFTGARSTAPTVTVRGAGSHRLPLQLGAGDVGTVGVASFQLNNLGVDPVDVACRLEPF